MVYVALLRGINVGGNSRVEMSKLKLLFETLGCSHITTYINSGNVIFVDSRPNIELGNAIERAIVSNFGFEIPVLLRDFSNIHKLCKQVAPSWTNDSKQKTDVLFLQDEINSPKILEMIDINPEIENVRYTNGALIWNINREATTRGSGVKLIKSDIYRHVTVRNINTVRKLNKLMNRVGITD